MFFVRLLLQCPLKTNKTLFHLLVRRYCVRRRLVMSNRRFMSDDFQKGPQDNVEGAVGDATENENPDEETGEIEYLRRLIQRLGLSKVQEEKGAQLLEEVTFNGVAKYIQSEKCQNIIVMCGAGISTSAGIPDFRTPGSGLYDNLQQYNLPYPQAVFELDFFKENPKPFFLLAKELFPGNFKPTTAHYFVQLLNDKGILLRQYTQNIDSLERLAGVPEEKLLEAHGTSYSAHCLRCRKLYDIHWLKREVFSDKIPTCTQDNCEGVVKPDIVFFGENLPERFSTLLHEDMPKCDLLIIMGTSLVVQPFASIVDRVPTTTPRLLINREKCGQSNFSFFGGGLMFDDPKNYRDVAWLGSCDDGCLALAELLGWKEELLELVESGHKKFDKEKKAENLQEGDIKLTKETTKGENASAKTEENDLSKEEEIVSIEEVENGLKKKEENTSTETVENETTKERNDWTKKEENASAKTEGNGLTKEEEIVSTEEVENGLTKKEENTSIKTGENEREGNDSTKKEEIVSTDEGGNESTKLTTETDDKNRDKNNCSLI